MRIKSRLEERIVLLLPLILGFASALRAGEDMQPRITRIWGQGESALDLDGMKVEVPIGTIFVEVAGFEPKKKVQLFVDAKPVPPQQASDAGTAKFKTELFLRGEYYVEAHQSEVKSQAVAVKTTLPNPPKIVLWKNEKDRIELNDHFARTGRCFFVSLPNVQSNDQVKLYLNGKSVADRRVSPGEPMRFQVELPQPDLYELVAEVNRYNIKQRSAAIRVYTNEPPPSRETFERPFEFSFPHQPTVTSLGTSHIPESKWKFRGNTDATAMVDDRPDTSIQDNNSSKDASAPDAAESSEAAKNEIAKDAPEENDATKNTMNSSEHADASVKNASDAVIYEFRDPAEFYVTRYGPDAVEHDDPELSIFEGMRLAFDRTGKYELRFTTSATRRPVSIQLQFALVNRTDGAGFNTLMTIPKIHIPLSITADEANRAPAKIFHTGYSPNIADCYHILKAISDRRCSSCPEKKSEWTIQRYGKARFGYGAEAL